MLSMILATDADGCIGKEGKLPWNDKEELNHFKHYTLHKTVIMGYNTFKSLRQPLPDRMNIVVMNCQRMGEELMTLQTHKNLIFLDYEQVLNYIKINPKSEIVVIGGAKTYRQFEGLVDEIVWSKGKFIVKGGDAYYRPDVDNGYWRLTGIEQLNDNFDVYTYKRLNFINRAFESVKATLHQIIHPTPVEPTPVPTYKDSHDG